MDLTNAPADASSDEDFVFLGRRRLRGIGRARLVADGSARGADRAARALALLRELEARDGVPRLVMGTIPFDPDKPAHLVVPARVVEVAASAAPAAAPAAEHRGVAPEPPADPAYLWAVERALDAIARGDVRKVVLARSVEVEAPDPIDTVALLQAFAARNPSAYGYHMPLGDDTVIVGASPELLVEVDRDVVRSHPLAGTAARSADPDDDARRRDSLLLSPKDRDEHAVLVTGLVGALQPLALALDVPDAPSILATDRLWHLGTPITGRLRPGTSALDIIHAAHPTAAVCGAPTAAAAGLVRALEAGERGAYAGVVGWMDSSGAGEWAIALRCATVRGGTARVHAGAGIVAGSTPEAEHAETGAKLRTALQALSDVAAVQPTGLVNA